jgi:hypothetical protein
MNIKQPFAEIVESSLSIWRAQSWQWDNFPSFGSLITVESNDRTLFGVVYNIETGSSDPSRSTFAYQKTEQELKNDQPQIFEFLQTTFLCLNIGYKQNGKTLYQLAPEPPKIHTFVSQATKEQMIEFFLHETYLHLLFGSQGQIFSLDELLLAILKQLSNINMLTRDKINSFIQTFSLLTANDYRRLKLFLQRADTIIKII